MPRSGCSLHESQFKKKHDQASDLWQQLELASELQSDLPGTVDWGRKWLVDFSAGKTQLVSLEKVNIKRRYVDKSMFLWIWQRVSCTRFLLYTFSSHILV